jgi:hypothetical protein
MTDDGDDYDIDFDIDLNVNLPTIKNEPTTAAEQNVTPAEEEKYSDAINYEEEWMAERRRHEVTKERLFLQEDEIVNLKTRIGKLEHADAATKASSTQRPPPSDNVLMQRIADLEEELRFSLGAAEDIRALKSKSINLVERIRVEKKEKARVEADVRSMGKKVDMLSVHIEKLMIHLKHEAAAKIKAMDSLRGSERRCNQLYDRNDLLTRKVAASDRCVHELREGSKILEDQLRLMDEKYLELRAKLDFSRGQSARKVEIAEKKATSLRVKYALLGNSKLLDTVDFPMSESQDIHVGFNDPATNSGSPSHMQGGNNQMIHRGSMKKRGGSAVPNVKRINMTPGFTPTDKDKAEECVLDKIRRNRGRKTIWTEEKLRNLTKTST